MANVKAITEICSTGNAAGLKPFIYITVVQSIDAIPAATALAIATNITMVSAEVFLKWPISKVPSKNIWDSIQTGDADSGARQTTLTFFIPKMTAARLDAIFQGCSYVIGVPDQNGEVRLVGELDNGCTMTVQETINEGTNGVTCVATWLSGHPPYFYTGDFVV